MVRIRIRFSDEQVGLLRERARREARSVSDLVRESVTRFLDEPPAPADRRELARRADALIGKFRSGVPDLASEHDRYFAESVGE